MDVRGRVGRGLRAGGLGDGCVVVLMLARGGRPRERQDKLRVFLCVFIDAVVGVDGDDGAEGERVGGVAEAPELFDFGVGQGADFGEVEVGREWFDAGHG